MADEAAENERNPGDPGPASSRDVAELAGHLLDLTRAGLPLPDGLRAAGAEVEDGPLRRILRETADRLERGETLDQALGAQRDRFPRSMRALVLAGARTGRMADLLAEFVRNSNLGHDLRRGVLVAVLYPALLLLLLGAVIFVTSRQAARAADDLTSTMRDFGLAATSHHDALLRVAAWIADWGPAAAGIAAAGVVLGWLGARVLLGPVARRRILAGLPLVGPMVRWSALAEFAHLLGLLLDAAVPLPEAIRLAGGSVRDADLADHADRMARSIESGEPLSVAALAWPEIPAGLGQLFRWGEGRRILPETLHLAGDLFEQRARSQAGYTNTVLLGLLLLMIANGLGFAVLILIQPMQLIMRLAGVTIW